MAFNFRLYRDRKSMPPITKNWRPSGRKLMSSVNNEDMKAPNMRGQSIRGSGNLGRLIDPRLRGQRLGGRQSR